MLELVGRGRAGQGTNQERQEEETAVLREKLNQGRETKRQTTTGEAVRRLQADQQSRQKEVVGLEGHPAEQDQAGDLIGLIDLIDLTDLSELV